MRTLTVFTTRAAMVLLGGALFGQHAEAQTAPSWVDARSTGAPAGFGSRKVMDALGNMYEIGSFSVSTSVGSTTLSTHGSYDGYLAKYTPAGTLAWVRQFGSAGEDFANDLALDAAGNVYVTGSFHQAIDLGNGQTLSAGTYLGAKSFVARFDPQGTLVWAQQNAPSQATNPSPTCPPSAAANGVYVDATSQQVVVTGYYTLSESFSFGGAQSLPRQDGSSPTFPTFMARFAAATGAPQSLTPAFYSNPSTGVGVIYPLRLVGAPGGGLYIVTDYFMATSFDNGLIIPAPASAEVLVAKYDAAGGLEWAHTFGGPDYDDISQATADAAGNLYLTGSFRQSLRFGTTALAGAGADDAFLVKYSPQGVAEWAQSLASPGIDYLTDVCVDAGGNAYVTGAFSNQARIGAATLASAGMKDVLVASYTTQGQLRWVQQAGGHQEERGLSLALTPQGGLRVTGMAGYNAAFGAITPTGLSTYTGFVAELAGSALAATTARALPQGLYPNPAIDQLYLPGLPVGTRVQLLDALGRVARETIVAAAAQVSVLGLPAGLYTLRATDVQGLQFRGRVEVQ